MRQHILEDEAYKPEALKTKVVDLAQLILTILLQQDSLYTLVKLEKTIKTPRTPSEKRTKCCFCLCVYKTWF